MPNYKVIAEGGGKWQLMSNERARLCVHVCKPSCNTRKPVETRMDADNAGPLHLSSAPQACPCWFILKAGGNPWHSN